MVKSLYYVLRAMDLIEGGGDHEVRLGHGEWVLAISEIKKERQVRVVKRSQKMRAPLSVDHASAPSDLPGTEEAFKVCGRREFMRVMSPC